MLLRFPKHDQEQVYYRAIHCIAVYPARICSCTFANAALMSTLRLCRVKLNSTRLYWMG